MNESRQFVVEVPMEGSDHWFPLARCLEPEGAAELVRVLLRHGKPDVVRVRIEVQFSADR